jgi:hypothetical protein
VESRESATHHPNRVFLGSVHSSLKLSPIDQLKSLAKLRLSAAEDEAAGDHVVEGLLFFGDTGEDITDEERNESGDDLREESARSARKGDGVTVEVGDDQAHHFFADGALPVGTFKVRIVEPATESGDA